VAALHAASCEPDADSWPERTFVLHAATADQLARLVEGRGTAGTSGSDGERSWFYEPDRWFELTAVAFTGDDHDLPLWTPPPAPTAVPGRREVRALLRRAERDGVTGADIWSAACRRGGPADMAVRRRAAWLCVRGEEPPMT
jgi:hypothetical protein